jgi:hypothetical protein
MTTIHPDEGWIVVFYININVQIEILPFPMMTIPLLDGSDRK